MLAKANTSFVLFYRAWRDIASAKNKITICIFIAEKTENVYDAAFRTIKSALKLSYIITPEQMIDQVERSSFSSGTVTANKMIWKR